MKHPYKSAPSRAFWEKSVSGVFNPVDVHRADKILIARGEKVMSAGSCFAANLVPYLEKAGIEYVRTERPPAALAAAYVESLSYHKFSAAYGNVYTARHLLQLMQRVLGYFSPQEDRWYDRGAVIDPFRPGLRFPAIADEEFDQLTRQHLDRVREAIQRADVFVFTLGLTEAWRSKIDGAVFPACPGTIAGEYDPALHEFHNFSVGEVVEDLSAAFALVRSIKRSMKFILTVSPVPLVATATNEHVLSATIYSKSVLRVAAQEMTQRMPRVTYFPAYEIVTGPQASHDFFTETRRDVSKAAVDTVMSVLLAHCDLVPIAEKGRKARLADPQAAAPAGAEERPERTEQAVSKPEAASRVDPLAALSAGLAAIECEEAAAGVDL